MYAGPGLASQRTELVQEMSLARTHGLAINCGVSPCLSTLIYDFAYVTAAGALCTIAAGIVFPNCRYCIASDTRRESNKMPEQMRRSSVSRRRCVGRFTNLLSLVVPHSTWAGRALLG